MSPDDLAFLAADLKQRSGLIIGADKAYLVESRLAPIARRRGLAGIAELIAEMRKPSGEALRAEVTEAMTTNESFFFRDKTPFDMFKADVLPGLMKARASQRTLRIWSAACSTGQEAYSLAMILKEMGPALAGWRIDIIGTDLSKEVLEKAKAGVYSQFEVQRGLPIQLLVKYFRQNGELWQIDAGIRAMVRYQHLNLLENFKALGNFDIVFCRNVLIYFDVPTKGDVLNRIAAQMSPDGFLFLGAAETVLGVSEAFRPAKDRRGLYMRSPPAGKTAG